MYSGKVLTWDGSSQLSTSLKKKKNYKSTTVTQFHLAGNEDWNEDKTEELEQDECLRENWKHELIEEKTVNWTLKQSKHKTYIDIINNEHNY